MPNPPSLLWRSWPASPECHHLCKLISDVKQRPQTQQFSGRFSELVAAFLIPRCSLAVGSQDGHVRIVEPISGVVLHEVDLCGDYIRAMAYEPSGKNLAIGCVDGRIRFVDTASGMRSSEFDVGEGSRNIRSLAYKPSGDHLAVGFYDGHIHVIDPESAAVVYRVITGGSVFSLAYSPRGERLAAAFDGGVGIVEDSQVCMFLSFPGYFGRSVAYNSTGTSLACGSHDGRVFILDPISGDFLNEVNLSLLTPRRGPIWTLSFDPDDASLAVCWDDGNVCIVNAGRLSLEINVAGCLVFSVVYKSSSKTFAALPQESKSRRVDLW